MSEETEIPTPFGTVHLPEIRELLPEFPPKAPKMDERRWDAMRNTLGIDLASIVGIIPVVGDIAADVAEDLHFRELRRILTSAELEEYLKQDQVAPSTIALIRTFMKIAP